MKKIGLLLVASVLALAFVSCGGKKCYCYTPDVSGVYETELYISDDLPCSSQNMSNRTCVEEYERMDPGQIAYTPQP